MQSGSFIGRICFEVVAWCCLFRVASRKRLQTLRSFGYTFGKAVICPFRTRAARASDITLWGSKLAWEGGNTAKLMTQLTRRDGKM